MTSAVGQDMESVCSRCGTSWHVVIAITGPQTSKVECKQCHSVHQHRSAKKATAQPKRSRASAAKKAPARIEADLQKPVRSYAIGEMFSTGERVEHPKFGLGVVQQSPGPGKVEILFGDEIKLLSQAKPPMRRFSP